MRGKIVAALLLIGAAACGDTGTNPGVDGDGQTGIEGGKGQAGGISGVSPTAARAASAARDCPQRCAFPIGQRAGQPAAQEAASITEDAGVLLLGGGAPVRWTLARGSRTLARAAGYSEAVARTQNGWGQVAGYSFGAANAATVWEPNGTPIVLSDRPYGQPLVGEARAINDNSVIVGVSGDRAFRTHYKEGFRWLSGPGSAANDVNFKGEVVGYSTVGGVKRATLWAPDGTATDLGILPGSYDHSIAVAISETSIVVGYSSSSTARQGLFGGFIWTRAEGSTALPQYFLPADVNHWGEVAGQNYFFGRCAVYYKGYGVLDLPRLTTSRLGCEATSINSWGDVAGFERVESADGRSSHGMPIVWTWGGNEGRYGF